MLDFSVNKNPFSPSRKLLNTIKKNVHLISEYPEGSNKDILKLINEFFHISPNHMGLGIGSTQILFDLPNMLDYKRAVILVPTFWEYTVFNKIIKKPIVRIALKPNDNFQIDYAYLQKKIKPRDCVYVCNVNNPTSVLHKKKDLLQIIDKNQNTHFVVDETYLLFREDYQSQTLAHESIKHKNLHVVISFSKFFSIPGLRLGVLFSNKKYIERYMEMYHIPYSMNPFTKMILENVLSDKSLISKSHSFYAKECLDFYERINEELKGRLFCYKPSGNFILARILTKQDSIEIKDAMEKSGYIIRGGHELIDLDSNWIRFSILSHRSNGLLLRSLDRILVNKGLVN